LHHTASLSGGWKGLHGAVRLSAVHAAASDDRAPAAGTSSESEQAPAEAVASKAPAAVEPEKKKDRAAAAAEEVVALRPAAAGEESARERLKRHRTEMAGRVRIPDMWGQERLLKDWVDCAVFDRPLAATTGLLTARDALVAECAAARSGSRTAARDRHRPASYSPRACS